MRLESRDEGDRQDGSFKNDVGEDGDNTEDEVADEEEDDEE